MARSEVWTPVGTFKGEAAVSVHFCMVLEGEVGGSPQKMRIGEGECDQQSFFF